MLNCWATNMNIILTKHALDRYNERCVKQRSKRELLKILQTCSREKIHDGATVFYNGKALFLMRNNKIVTTVYTPTMATREFFIEKLRNEI